MLTNVIPLEAMIDYTYVYSPRRQKRYKKQN